MTRFVPLVFVGLLALANVAIEGTVRPKRGTEQILYFPSGERVKLLWSGFEGLGGDIYWLRTIQYYGGQRAFAQEKRYDLLAPLLDITATLAPRFDIVYKYGAIFLAEPNPLGADDPEGAIALMERGVAANPESWRMRQHLAYCTYLYHGDLRAASTILQDAAKLPGAPFWLETLAAQFLAGEERAAARAMWIDLFQRAETETVKLIARTNLKRLDAMDAMDALRDRVDEYRRLKGRLPQTLDELRAAGLVPAVPNDPTNVPFDYDPSTGTVSIGRASALWAVDLPATRKR
jgi:hypothetical protein